MGNLPKEFNTIFGAPDIYRRLAEGVRAGIYVADAKGNLIYVNQAFVNILGYTSKDEVIGLNLADQLYVHPEDRKAFLKKMEKVGFVRDYEVENKRKSGSTAVLSVTSNFIYGERSEIIGVEGVVHDITEHHKLQKELMVLRNAVEQTADHVMITDKNGVIQYVNPVFEKTTGYTKQEVLRETPKILQSGKQPRSYYKELWDTILAGNTFYAHTTNKKKNGELYVADQTITPVKNEFGEITHFVSIWKDVTEKMKLEERLRTEKQKLEEIIGFDEKISMIRKSDKLMDFVVTKTMKILGAGKCSIMLIDKEHNELGVKASAGFAENIALMRVKLHDSITSRMIQDGQPLLVKDVKTDLPTGSRDVAYLGKSFMIVPVKLSGDIIGVINVADKQASVDQDDVFNESDLKIFCAIAREVAVAMENVKFFKELQYLTITDPLTGIANFRGLTDSLEFEIKRFKRFQGNWGLMMMDIDDFKSYNDTFGHPAGDQLLKDLAKIIRDNLREVDILCRYAGDEFAVILPGTDKPGSAVLAERIRKEIVKASFLRPVTVSIGAAQYKKDMVRHEIISKADRALYQAKKEGKNRVCVLG